MNAVEEKARRCAISAWNGEVGFSSPASPPLPVGTTPILDAANAALAADEARYLSDVETAIIVGAIADLTYEDIAEQTGYSINYIKRDIGPKLWRRLSQALNEKVSKTNFQQALKRHHAHAVPHPATRSSRTAKQDWGEAPDVSFFVGREAELTTLQTWMLQDRCRIVALLGMGGIGKTALSVKLAEQTQAAFECVIWRSLRNAPSLESLLSELVPFLSQQQETEPTTRRFLHCLRQNRCLIVLDNMETILQAGGRAGYYRAGYEPYGDLLRVMGDSSHQSCVLVTSREKPVDVGIAEGVEAMVRSLSLRGAPEASQALLRVKGVRGTEADQQQLCDRYGCNPLALKIVSTAIQDVFDGEIAVFLQQDTTFFNSLRRLLEKQFNRLSDLEQIVMYWLAINREWTTIAELEMDITPSVSRSALLEALESLSWRCLIETASPTPADKTPSTSLNQQRESRYTQQPVVMEFMTDIIIHRVSQELLQRKPDLFQNLALLKAQARDYIRDIQARLIVQPVVAELMARLGSIAAIDARLMAGLEQARQPPFSQASYLAGNSINLMRQLGIDLNHRDFSQLPIRQANFQGLALRGVDFTAADLSTSLFTQRFGGILSVAFSPDQSLLATADTNGDICLWRVADGQPIKTFKGHTNWVLSVAFLPTGDRLASGSLDRTIRIWDIASGDCLSTLTGHEDAIWSVTFSPDGRRLASSSFDCTIRLWDTASGDCLTVLTGHENSVRAVAFSPVGDRLASSSADLTVKLWDLATYRCMDTLRGHDETVWSVAFSPNGRQLVSGSDDSTVRLWNLSSGQCRLCLSGHSHSVWSVAFRPDGQTVASGSQDGTVRLWDVQTGHCIHRLMGHTNWVWSVAFSSSGDWLASGSQDRVVRLWQVQSGKCFRTLSGYTNTVWSLAFDASGDVLASGSQDGYLRLWDVCRDRCLDALAHDGMVTAVALSPDGQWLASGSHAEESTLQLWTLAERHLVKTLTISSSAVRAIAFSPDSQLVAASSDDWSIQVWHVVTGELKHTLQGHTNGVWSVAFSPNGQWLASASFDHTVRLWRMADGICDDVLEHTGEVGTLDFSPDGTLLATGASADSTVKIWQMRDRTCIRTLAGHHNFIMAIAFSADGTQLVSSSFDQTVRLWDVETGDCLRVFQGHSQGLWSVAFSPDGRTIASGGDDETVCLWDVNEDACVRSLTLPGLYDGMNIAGVTGLTEAQQTTLKTLGAIEAD